MKKLLIMASALAFATTAAQACPFMKSAEHDAKLTTASIQPADHQKPLMSERKDLQAYEPDFDDSDPAEAETTE